MELNIFTDGGSLNNPGQAAYAFAIYQNNKLIYSEGKTIGVATNNVAEYTALIKAFEKLKEILTPSPYPPTAITIFSDSQLMVNQVNGLFKVKNTTIRKFIFKIRVLEQEINQPIIYKHISRDKNSFADSLVKKALGR